MTHPLRIAILTHSTNPRGGVVHALELGDALARLGHEPVVHAPDASGRGFFRSTTCATVSVSASPSPVYGRRWHGEAMTDEGTPQPPASPHPTSLRAATFSSGAGEGESQRYADTLTLVQTRAADYVRHFEHPEHRRFDVFHAQDGISANALATLKEGGLIDHFARTVHHIDDFADPELAALQRRAIVAADAHFVVSRPWQKRLQADFGLGSTIVGNGVDLRRFGPRPAPDDLILRHRLGLQSGPVYLAIGGIEARKNTLRILEAFAQVFSVRPAAQLVIAGGSSLLDHGAYQARFAAALAASGLPAHAVLSIGAVADPDMPALYRNADALVFPSLSEGFGLVVLEALASGLPVVTSLIPPFTDYLGESDAIWCTPDNVASIADAMMLTLLPPLRTGLVRRGPAVAARHDWRDTAAAHLDVYQRLGAVLHA